MNTDYDVSIFIVTEDNEWIYHDDYDSIDDGFGCFIALTNDRLNPDVGNDNTICLSTEYLGGTDGKKLNPIVCKKRNTWAALSNSQDIGKFIWQADLLRVDLTHTCDDIQKSSSDFDGHEHTIEIMNQAQRLFMLHNNNDTLDVLGDEAQRYIGNLEDVQLEFPVFFAAYTSTVRLNGRDIHGYLPSIGQLQLIKNNDTKINNIIKSKLYNDLIIHFNKIVKIPEHNLEHNLFFFDKYTKIQLYQGFWASSTLMSDQKFICHMLLGNIRLDNRINNNSVLPLYVLQ